MDGSEFYFSEDEEYAEHLRRKKRVIFTVCIGILLAFFIAFVCLVASSFDVSALSPARGYDPEWSADSSQAVEDCFPYLK